MELFISSSLISIYSRLITVACDFLGVHISHDLHLWFSAYRSIYLCVNAPAMEGSNNTTRFLVIIVFLVDE